MVYQLTTRHLSKNILKRISYINHQNTSGIFTSDTILSNNNIQERLNGEFRDKEKVFCGLKKDDSPDIAGIQVYHNYIRPHMSLDNGTPAKRAGIDIK